MKNFIKFILIFLSLFITLGANASDIQNYQSPTVISTADEVIKVLPDEFDNAISASNSKNHEILSLGDRKIYFGNGLVLKSSAQNKLLQQYFNKEYNKLFISSSHKISSYLKNEICTRAP